MHFAAPLLAVLATLGATVEAQRATCNRKQYADVAHQIQNPAYFCKFYLKQSRKTSPLRKYGSRSLTQLCKCFVQNSPRVQGPFEPLRPNPAPKTCPINLYRALRNQYQDPDYFCRWYLSAPRTLSPLPSQANPKVVEKACRCFLNRQFPPQTTTTRATTPVATDEPTDTSSTDEPAATTTTTDIVGPIGGTTTTSRETTTTRASTSGASTLATLTTSTAAGQTTSAAGTTALTSTVNGGTTSTASASSSATS